MNFNFAAAARVYVAVAESPTLTVAAARLGLTLSAVSHAVTRLEEQLGTLLLQRHSRGLQITEAGEAFLEKAKVALDAIEQAMQLPSPTGHSLRGRLRVAAPVDIGIHLLAPHLAAFCAGHPDLRLDLRFEDRTIDPAHEGIDAALRVGDQGDERLVYRPLGRLRFVAVASPAYLSRRTSTTATPTFGLEGHRVIARRDSGMRTAKTYGGPSASGHDAACAVEASEGALSSLALAGLGVAVVPHACVRRELASGELIDIVLEPAPPEQPVWMAHPPRGVDRDKLLAFAGFVEHVLEG